MDYLLIVSVIMAIVNVVSITLLIQTYLSLRKNDGATTREFAKLLFGVAVEIIFATIALIPLNYNKVVIWGILRSSSRLYEIVRIELFIRFIQNARFAKNNIKEASNANKS